jgi:hypothetical protein
MLFDLAKAEIMVHVLRINLNLSTKHFMRRKSTSIVTSQEIKIVSLSPKDIPWLLILLFGRSVIFEVIKSIATIQNDHGWTSGTFSCLRSRNLRRRQWTGITHHQMILFLFLGLHISWDIIPIVPHILGFFILVWELLLHINYDTRFLTTLILLSQLGQGTVSTIVSLTVKDLWWHIIALLIKYEVVHNQLI